MLFKSGKPPQAGNGAGKNHRTVKWRDRINENFIPVLDQGIFFILKRIKFFILKRIKKSQVKKKFTKMKSDAYM